MGREIEITWFGLTPEKKKTKEIIVGIDEEDTVWIECLDTMHMMCAMGDGAAIVSTVKKKKRCFVAIPWYLEFVREFKEMKNRDALILGLEHTRDTVIKMKKNPELDNIYVPPINTAKE